MKTAFVLIRQHYNNNNNNNQELPGSGLLELRSVMLMCVCNVQGAGPSCLPCFLYPHYTHSRELCVLRSYRAVNFPALLCQILRFCILIMSSLFSVWRLGFCSSEDLKLELSVDPPSHSRNGRSWICSGEFTLQVPIELIQRTNWAQAEEAATAATAVPRHPTKVIEVVKKIKQLKETLQEVTTRCLSVLCGYETSQNQEKEFRAAAGRSILPQLHDTGDIPRGIDPPDVVKVSHENAAISSTRQRQRGQKFVAFCLPITAGAGNATAAAISCNIRFNSIKNKSKTPAETNSIHRSLQRST